jgi:hypothetical protein
MASLHQMIITMALALGLFLSALWLVLIWATGTATELHPDQFWFATRTVLVTGGIAIITSGILFKLALHTSPRHNFPYSSVITSDVAGIVTIYGLHGSHNNRSRVITKINLNGVAHVRARMRKQNGRYLLALYGANTDLPVDDIDEQSAWLILRNQELPWLDIPMVDAALVKAFAPYIQAGSLHGLTPDSSLKALFLIQENSSSAVPAGAHLRSSAAEPVYQLQN